MLKRATPERYWPLVCLSTTNWCCIETVERIELVFGTVLLENLVSTKNYGTFL